MEKADLGAIAVIPARFGSIRFPGKPLAMLAGKPMIAWVVEQAQRVPHFGKVIVATDDDRIFQAVKDFGGEVMMTSSQQPSGTDRVWEVAQQYPHAQIIFNIQGDEPQIDPQCLEEACNFLSRHHETVDIVTLKAPISTQQEFDDPNVVKVVTNQNHQALYFSRSGIPYDRDGVHARPEAPYGYRHIGVYGYGRSALERFVALPVSPLESIEKLEQLRALEAGQKISVLTIPKAPQGIDTLEDLRQVESQLAVLTED